MIRRFNPCAVLCDVRAGQSQQPTRVVRGRSAHDRQILQLEAVDTAPPAAERRLALVDPDGARAALWQAQERQIVERKQAELKAARELRARQRAQREEAAATRVRREQQKWRAEERDREDRRLFLEAVCHVESERAELEAEVAEFVSMARLDISRSTARSGLPAS